VKKIFVEAFVINEESQKRIVMDYLLSNYSYNTNITKQLLKNSYVAGLFDSTKKELLFLTF
jgi:hypothetical protein